MAKNKLKAKCYNCIYASKQFKIGALTHLHCEHPSYTKEQLKSGEVSGWETLRVFNYTCPNHEFNERAKNKQLQINKQLNTLKL